MTQLHVLFAAGEVSRAVRAVRDAFVRDVVPRRDRYESTRDSCPARPPREPAPLPHADADARPAARRTSLCELIYEQTGSDWLAESSYYVLVKPLRIILIILIALLAPVAAAPADQPADPQPPRGSVPAMLEPLRERMPDRAQDAPAIVPERRRQRAEAIGSVLRSSSRRSCSRSRPCWSWASSASTWRRCWPAPASPASRSASARRAWSRTSSPGCSCCWRTSTASATRSTSARRAAWSRRSACGSPPSATRAGCSGTSATARSSGSATRARAGRW